MYMCMHERMYECTNACMHVCMNLCMYAFMRACIKELIETLPPLPATPMSTRVGELCVVECFGCGFGDAFL